MATKNIQLIVTSVPDMEFARKIAYSLVSELSLAACVNIISKVQSIYRWKNEIVNDSEYMLCIKAPKENEKEIYGAIKKLHCYDLPEIISVPITKASDEYINWIRDSCTV